MVLGFFLTFGLVMYLNRQHGLVAARSVQIATALTIMSACGDSLTGRASTQQQESSSSASVSTLSTQIRFSLRDSVLFVGDSSATIIEDSLLLAGSRRRFFAPSVQWRSTDTLVAKVSSAGTVHARSAGTVSIVAYTPERTGSRTLLVESRPDTPVAPDPTPPPPPAPPVPPAGGPDELLLPADNPAELPRLQVTLPTVEGGGTIRRVAAGQSIQAAVNAASYGDVILLAPGAVYNESVQLKKKSGSGWITIRTDATPTEPGKRVALSDSTRFARIRSPGGNLPTITTETSAAGYWLVNLDLTVAPATTYLNTLVNLDTPNQNALDRVPSRIVLDRVLVRGRPNLPLRRCISLQSAHTAVIHSVVVECHEKGFDSQAIAGWNGPGPYLIENNLLEGAGENIMFGGANASIPGLNPSDITIRWNLIRKPVEWRNSNSWTVKNLLELKSGVRVLMHHNIFENHWIDAQSGWAIVLYSVADNSWNATSDVIFAQNIVRNSASGLNIYLGKSGVAQAMTRVYVGQNIVVQLGTQSLFGGEGAPFQILGGGTGMHLVDNTAVGEKFSLYLPPDGNPPRGQNFRFSRNVVSFGTYGVFGGAFGVNSVASRYDTFEFTGNCFFEATANANPADYPQPNRLSNSSRALLMPGLAALDVTLAPGNGCSQMLPGGKSPGANPALSTVLETRVRTGIGKPQ